MKIFINSVSPISGEVELDGQRGDFKVVAGRLTYPPFVTGEHLEELNQRVRDMNTFFPQRWLTCHR